MNHQWLRKNLNKTYREQDKLKRDLLNFKNKAIAYVINDKIGITSAKLIKFLNKQYDYDKMIFLVPLSAFIIKECKKDNITLYKINDNVIKFINNRIRKYIDNKKIDILKKYVDMARKDGRYYYLASSHDDSALDHEDWQAKIYYDNRMPMNYYIYGYRELQWVIDDPVYFLTRPYCRHYFVAITYDEALKGDIEYLKQKYKTHTLVGDRRMQTPKTRNVALYEDRLRLLEEMYKKNPSLDLEKQILKTKILLKKWKGLKL